MKKLFLTLASIAILFSCSNVDSVEEVTQSEPLIEEVSETEEVETEEVEVYLEEETTTETSDL
jgi:hypothetical protein